MFKNEVPFISGIFTGACIIAIIWFSTLDGQAQFDINDHPRIQSITGKAYMKDAWLVEVRVQIRTKENLHTPFMEAEAREFIGKVTAQFTSQQMDKMSLKFQNDTIKYLGLPCSTQLVSVNIGPVE